MNTKAVQTEWKVAFTRHAEEDIKRILVYIVEHDGTEKADLLLKDFLAARDSLKQLPERGRIPPELMRVNIHAYREIQAKAYRIIYQINHAKQTVNLHIIADARRNFTELVKERLFFRLCHPHA